MKEFLKRWAINSLAVLVAVYLVDGMHARGWLADTIRYQQHLDVLIAALVLGILNAFVRPLLMLLTIPLVIFSLGLFTLVINALMLWLTGSLLSPRFVVQGFWPAFWGALIISVVSLCLNSITGANGSRVKMKVVRPKSRRDGGDDQVIDV